MPADPGLATSNTKPRPQGHSQLLATPTKLHVHPGHSHPLATPTPGHTHHNAMPTQQTTPARPFSFTGHAPHQATVTHNVTPTRQTMPINWPHSQSVFAAAPAPAPPSHICPLYPVPMGEVLGMPWASLTHGLQLPDELLLGPLGPLLLVGVDGAEDGPARLPAVLDGGHIQVMHQHDVGVLWGQTGWLQ